MITKQYHLRVDFEFSDNYDKLDNELLNFCDSVFMGCPACYPYAEGVYPSLQEAEKAEKAILKVLKEFKCELK